MSLFSFSPSSSSLFRLLFSFVSSCSLFLLLSSFLLPPPVPPSPLLLVYSAAAAAADADAGLKRRTGNDETGYIYFLLQQQPPQPASLISQSPFVLLIPGPVSVSRYGSVGVRSSSETITRSLFKAGSVSATLSRVLYRLHACLSFPLVSALFQSSSSSSLIRSPFSLSLSPSLSGASVKILFPRRSLPSLISRFSRLSLPRSSLVFSDTHFDAVRHRH